MSNSELELLNRSDLLAIAQGVFDRLDGLVHRSLIQSKRSSDDPSEQIAFQAGYLESAISMLLKDIYKLNQNED